MKLTSIDKTIRLVLGFIMVFWAASGGPSWSWFGIYLLLSGSWGFCITYKILSKS